MSKDSDMTVDQARELISATLGLVKASGFTVINSASGSPIRSDWMRIEKNASRLYPDLAKDKMRTLRQLLKALR